jgi:hypothetical protein
MWNVRSENGSILEIAVRNGTSGTSRQFTAGVIDIGGKYAPSVVNTGGKFSADVIDISGKFSNLPLGFFKPVVHLDL